MRKAVAVFLVIGLVACSREASGPARQGRTIDCALADSTSFAGDCTVDVIEQGGRKILVVRGPRGAFRRFEAVSDGRGAIPADGSQGVTASWMTDGRLQLTVDGDRYLFPASVRPDDAATP